MPTKMNARLLFLAVLAVVAVNARAQTLAAKDAKARPSLELTYDYIHSNAPPSGCGCFSVNGGGAAVTYPVSSNFRLVGKVGVGHAGGIGANGLDLTLSTYTVGGRYYPKWKYTRWHPYGELQAGGAYAGGNLIDSASSNSSASRGAFAGSVGGGLDVLLNRRFSLKVADLQYLVTTFSNGDTDHQNDLRVSAGLVVNFGHPVR